MSATVHDNNLPTETSPTPAYATTFAGTLIHRPGDVADRTWCGRDINEHLDEPPPGSKPCRRCETAVAHHLPRTTTVECPTCGAKVTPGFGGRLLPHREWRVGPAGPYQTDHLCTPDPTDSRNDAA